MSQEFDKMVAGPIGSDAIALTEKKVDMALDDIIKMSKNSSDKGKMQRRTSNKSRAFNGDKSHALKVRRYMDSRSAVRQGALAKRRSNFQGNQFNVTAEVAKKAAVAPTRVRAFGSVKFSKTNKSRVGVPPAQGIAKLGFASKWLPGQKEKQVQQQGNGVANKQRTQAQAQAQTQTQTLDSLFASMKEQRMMTFSSQQKSGNAWNAGRRGRVPWARGRFGN